MRYYYQIEGLLRNNLGDIIQGLAAKQFLPNNLEVTDRERPDLISSEQGFLIANGWYQHKFEHYPPPANITPFFISVHIAKSDFLKVKEIREYFKKHSPIGCRDKKTLWLLRGFGIPAYYSACLTLTLRAKNLNIEKNNQVLWVDNQDHPIPMEIENKLNEFVVQGITKINHDPINIDNHFVAYSKENTQLAIELLETYQKASLVLTTKIHCALPCIALGVPVILVHPDPTDPRLDALHALIEVISYKQFSKLKKLPIAKVNTKKLLALQNRLNNLTNMAVEENGNPFKSSKHLELILQDKYYRIISNLTATTVKLFWKFGLNKNQLEKVFGLTFLNEKN